MSFASSFLVLALAACHRGVDCGEGERPNSQGECVELPGGDDVEGYDALPACEPGSPDARIEVEAGCADGACSGSGYDTIVAALGDAGVCENFSGLAFCVWQDGGLQTFFTDDDGDAVPDTGSVASGIHLASPYDGATEDGLGLDVSMACWLDVYGFTDDVEYLPVGDESFITELWWPDRGLFVDDFAAGDGEAPDGVPDSVSLFGVY